MCFRMRHQVFLSSSFHPLLLLFFFHALLAVDVSSQQTRPGVPDVADLIKALQEKDARVRENVAEKLGQMGPGASQAVDPLLLCLSDPDPYVIGKSAEALSRIGTAAVPGLVRVLEHGVPVARWPATIALGKIGPDAHPAVPALTRALTDSSDEVRWGAAVALGNIGPKAESSAPALMLMLSDRDQDVRQGASLALDRFDSSARDDPVPVTFKPGSKFGYSGEGIYFLQRVVEHITGEPLNAYARRTMLDPMGLAHTSFIWTEEHDARIAGGHDSEGKFLEKTRYTHPNAAYTLYTSADDYARFLIEIMNPTRSAPYSLRQSSIDAMLSRQVVVTSREPIERPGRARGSEVYWGLGWSMNATARGDIYHHSGANRSGFRCFSQFKLATGSGIVIMTNGMGGGDLWTRLISRVGNL